MSNRFKLLVAFCAVVAAVAAYQEARAGNVNVVLDAPVEYFSVELEENEAISYSGTDTGAIILIDDVTYSAWMEPSDRTDRDRYFNEYDLMATIEQIQSGELELDYHLRFSRDWYDAVTREWSEARGADFGAFLLEYGEDGPANIFDRFTHSTHSEFLARQRKEAFAQFHFVAWLDGSDDLPDPYPSLAGPGSAGAGAGGQGIGMGLGLSSWATPTSQSRHYQTPQVVGNQNAAGFVVEVPGPGIHAGLTSYTRARCNLKGRVIPGGAGWVAESTDIAISNIVVGD